MNLAADELCVTHGAIGRQARGLERLCSVRLTQGPRNSLRLTEAGLSLAESLDSAFGIERSFTTLR